MWQNAPEGMSNRNVPQPRSYEDTQRNPGDREAQLSQRPIAVHALEHLATSDRGIAMFRRLLKKATQAVARGEDPPGILRDPNQLIVQVGARNEVRAPAE